MDDIVASPRRTLDPWLHARVAVRRTRRGRASAIRVARRCWRTLRRAGRSARSCRCCSRTWSGSRHVRSGWTPRTCGASYSRCTPACGRARAARRHGGEVHRRCGDGCVRGAGGARGRPRAGGARGAGILEALAEDGDVEVRIGITTGEALIALETRPEAGEGIASGDVVNTASRLQAAAPVGAILVDDTTYRASERAIEYEAAEPVSAKGKAEPIPVWQALRTSTRAGVGAVGRRPVGGSQRGAVVVAKHARARAGRVRAAARDAGRRAGHRQESADGRAGLPRARPSRCAGSRATRCPTARGLRSGPSERWSRRTARSSSPTLPNRLGRSSAPRLRRCWPSPRRRTRSSATCGRWPGSRPRTSAPATAAARPSRPGGASSRRSPSSTRSCSPSRTCIGPTTTCSTSSTTCSTGPRVSPCWCWPAHARSC